MNVSGKKTLFIMFAIILALCLWVRQVAPKLKGSVSSQSTDQAVKPKPGYRTKHFPTMEEARTAAEKKINNGTQQKSIITKYKSYEDGWIFEYESEKYLNSANPKDKLPDNLPIYVNKDGVAVFFSDEKNK